MLLRQFLLTRSFAWQETEKSSGLLKEIEKDDLAPPKWQFERALTWQNLVGAKQGAVNQRDLAHITNGPFGQSLHIQYFDSKDCLWTYFFYDVRVLVIVALITTPADLPLTLLLTRVQKSTSHYAHHHHTHHTIILLRSIIPTCVKVYLSRNHDEL